VPGDVTSRAGAVRDFLLRRWPGRLLLLGGAIKLVFAIARRLFGTGPALLDVVDTLGSLALVFGAGYFIYRLAVRAKRRLLWRVRRKLILSYIFIGFVPALLIVAFFVVSGLMLILNVGSYLVRSGLDDVIGEARYIADTTVRDLERSQGPGVAAATLDEELEGLATRYPDAAIALVPTGADPGANGADNAASALRTSASRVRSLTVGRWSHVEPPVVLPAWVTPSGYSGILAASLGTPATPSARRACCSPRTSFSSSARSRCPSGRRRASRSSWTSR
jgi:hypothetical protein